MQYCSLSDYILNHVGLRVPVMLHAINTLQYIYKTVHATLYTHHFNILHQQSIPIPGYLNNKV